MSLDAARAASLLNVADVRVRQLRLMPEIILVTLRDRDGRRWPGSDKVRLPNVHHHRRGIHGFLRAAKRASSEATWRVGWVTGSSLQALAYG